MAYPSITGWSHGQYTEDVNAPWNVNPIVGIYGRRRRLPPGAPPPQASFTPELQTDIIGSALRGGMNVNIPALRDVLNEQSQPQGITDNERRRRNYIDYYSWAKRRQAETDATRQPTIFGTSLPDYLARMPVQDAVQQARIARAQAQGGYGTNIPTTLASGETVNVPANLAAIHRAERGNGPPVALPTNQIEGYQKFQTQNILNRRGEAANQAGQEMVQGMNAFRKAMGLDAINPPVSPDRYMEYYQREAQGQGIPFDQAVESWALRGLPPHVSPTTEQEMAYDDLRKAIEQAQGLSASPNQLTGQENERLLQNMARGMTEIPGSAANTQVPTGGQWFRPTPEFGQKIGQWWQTGGVPIATEQQISDAEAYRHPNAYQPFLTPELRQVLQEQANASRQNAGQIFTPQNNTDQLIKQLNARALGNQLGDYESARQAQPYITSMRTVLASFLNGSVPQVQLNSKLAETMNTVPPALQGQILQGVLDYIGTLQQAENTDQETRERLGQFSTALYGSINQPASRPAQGQPTNAQPQPQPSQGQPAGGQQAANIPPIDTAAYQTAIASIKAPVNHAMGFFPSSLNELTDAVMTGPMKQYIQSRATQLYNAGYRGEALAFKILQDIESDVAYAWADATGGAPLELKVWEDYSDQQAGLPVLEQLYKRLGEKILAYVISVTT